MGVSWTRGSCFKASAEEAKRVMDKLAEEGRLTPADLVEVSRPKDAPLHQDFFSLTDMEAAQKWREHRATVMIASIVVTREEEETPIVTRAYFNIERGTRQYIQTEIIMSDEAKKERLLEVAKRELEAFRAKYRNLEMLSGVMSAIDDVLKEGRGA